MRMSWTTSIGRPAVTTARGGWYMRRTAATVAMATPERVSQSHAGALMVVAWAADGAGACSALGMRDRSEIASRRDSGRPGARSCRGGAVGRVSQPVAAAGLAGSVAFVGFVALV